MSAVSRREFLKVLYRALALAGLGGVAAPVASYLYPPSLEETPSVPVRVCKQEELPVGASKIVGFGRFPAIVIHIPEGLRAYSAVCTHFACVVQWDAESGLIACPCHEGYFDPGDGHVVAGPPPSGLQPIPVCVENDDIYIGDLV